MNGLRIPFHSMHLSEWSLVRHLLDTSLQNTRKSSWGFIIITRIIISNIWPIGILWTRMWEGTELNKSEPEQVKIREKNYNVV